MWFITSQRNLAGFSKGLLVIALVIFVPARDIQDLTVSLSWNCCRSRSPGWCSARVFSSGRATRLVARGVAGTVQRLPRLARGTAGREFDLMLGTPTRGCSSRRSWCRSSSPRDVERLSRIWLFFLTIFSTVSGAVAGEAAGRSRALWLRGSWTREPVQGGAFLLAPQQHRARLVDPDPAVRRLRGLPSPCWRWVCRC